MLNFVNMTKKTKDNLCNNFNSVLSLNVNQFLLMDKYNLRMSSFRDLVLITTNYIKNSKASSLSYLVKNNDYSGRAYLSIRLRVNNLIDKGLVVDISSNYRVNLIPTELAIKELQKLVSIEDQK